VPEAPASLRWYLAKGSRRFNKLIHPPSQHNQTSSSTQWRGNTPTNPWTVRLQPRFALLWV
jgi:hypothetical protein